MGIHSTKSVQLQWLHNIERKSCVGTVLCLFQLSSLYSNNSTHVPGIFHIELAIFDLLE